MHDRRSMQASLLQEAGPWYNAYVGTAEQLIAAGLCTLAHLPGLGCAKKHLATFYNGAPYAKGNNGPKDDRYLSVRRMGRRYRVLVGVSEGEEARRRAGGVPSVTPLLPRSEAFDDFLSKVLTPVPVEGAPPPALDDGSLEQRLQAAESALSFAMKLVRSLRD